MQKLFLFIKGYVYIRITGFAPERFVNLCGNRGIFLWGLNKEEDAYYMFMKLKDFFLIAPLVRKTKTKVVLLKRIGLPFLVPEIYKRKMFMFGMILSFWMWWLSSFFVWKIELEGNQMITDEDILRTLLVQNVMVGGKVKDVNYEELEKYLRNMYSDIIWISVKQNGTILEINMKENTTTEISKQNTKTCDLISTVDGILRQVVVRKGVPMVSVGQEVKKGDVLISGRIEILNDDATVREVKMVSADADLWIEYELPIHISIPKIYTKKQYTGRNIVHHKIVLDNGKSFETPQKNTFRNYDVLSVTKDDSRILLWKLPVNFIKITSREFYKMEQANDLDEGTQKLEKEFTDFLANLMEKGVQIISKNVRIEETSKHWVLSGTITLWEQAKEEKLIEDVYE